jgi:hypothetical protein
MIRPPPGGVPAHNLDTSSRHILTIANRRSGMMNGRGVSGATVGTAATGGGADGGGVSFAVGAVAGFAAVVDLTTFEGAAGGGCAAADGVGAAVAADAEAGVAAAGDAAAAGMIALTAVWHARESLARFCLRQSSASLPPGVTPEQFAMKSDRQFERIALV